MHRQWEAFQGPTALLCGFLLVLSQPCLNKLTKAHLPSLHSTTCKKLAAWRPLELRKKDLQESWTSPLTPEGSRFSFSGFVQSPPTAMLLISSCPFKPPLILFVKKEGSYKWNNHILKLCFLHNLSTPLSKNTGCGSNQSWVRPFLQCQLN